METHSVRFMVAILFVMTTLMLHAQKTKLPPFKMLQSNGKIFTAHDLPMGKPILIVYFSPDCDHCEKMLKEFFKQSSGFQKASIAFITYLPVDQVSKFEKEYSLAKFSNMFAGTEGATFFVRNYYKIVDMPFAALYTRDGDFVTSYERKVDLKALIEKLKDLQ